MLSMVFIPNLKNQSSQTKLICHIIKALKQRRSHSVQFDFGKVTEAYSKHGTNKFHISMVLELQSVELNQLQMKGHSKTAKHLNCNFSFCNNESNSTAQAHLLHLCVQCLWILALVVVVMNTQSQYICYIFILFQGQEFLRGQRYTNNLHLIWLGIQAAVLL